MEDTGQEVEIKIEYYESFEKDPLKVKSGSKLVTYNENLYNDQSVYLENDIVKKSNSKINKNSLIACTDFDVEYADDSIENNEVKTTIEPCWYKEIDETDKFICKFCNLSYLYLDGLRRHVKTKHPIEAKSLKVIIGKSKRKSTPKCHICKSIFDNICKLKSHLHGGHKIEDIVCNCNYCETDVFERIDEKKELKSRNRFQCPICPQTVSRKYALNTHIKVKHTTEKDYEYSCLFCPYKAPIHYYLLTHIAANHRETEYAKTQNLHFCNICGYRTLRKSHFLKHKLSHSSSKKNKCSYCDYVTTNSANLKVHTRIHTNEKPYFCNVKECDYRCSAKSALRSHQLRHDREKNYIYCDKCSYRTLFKQCLKRHYVRHVQKS